MSVPLHIAIIMDGNGRWATQRGMPRCEGHRQGALAAQQAIESCIVNHIPILTLFAFGLENNARPPAEVQFLFDMLFTTLREDAQKLREKGVSLRVIGDRSTLSENLQQTIAAVEACTAEGAVLTLNLAINFSGQWDIMQATRRIAAAVRSGALLPSEIHAATIQSYLSLGDLPPPDLLIRTGAVSRISNFLLFDLAYTELYFSPVMWPDFAVADFDRALQDYAQRERRYGRIGVSAHA